MRSFSPRLRALYAGHAGLKCERSKNDVRANRSEGAPTAEEVLAAIKEHLLDWNQAPTITELTTKLNCGRSTVQRAISKLEGEGWISRRPKATRGLRIGRIR
jgi:DNA-binding GntR family transcriptional regulator